MAGSKRKTRRRRPASARGDRQASTKGGQRTPSKRDRGAAAQWLGVAVLAAVIVAGIVWWTLRPPSDSTRVGVVVPELSPRAKAGEAAFRRSCATCHGETAGGTNKGPALVHAIYRPGHHDDGAFRRAISGGVRRHHWRFGDMPPQRQVEGGDIGAIIAYVRELQRANGIN